MKARVTYPFGKRTISNKWNFVGIFVGASVGMLIVYIPPFHWVFGGSHSLSPLYWLIPMAFGVLLLAWASMRVVLFRKSNERARVRDIRGLMMCECYLWIAVLQADFPELTDPTLEA